jgi:hypothetical protein
MGEPPDGSAVVRLLANCTEDTHVDDDALTEVVVVWDGFEVLHSCELAVRGRPILVLAAQFRQRPATQDHARSHTEAANRPSANLSPSVAEFVAFGTNSTIPTERPPLPTL